MPVRRRGLAQVTIERSIARAAPRRVSDAAEMALIEFVGAEDPGYKKRGKGGPARKAEKVAAVASAAAVETVPETSGEKKA